MTTHSSTLAWRIPGTGEPRGLPSMGLHRGGQQQQQQPTEDLRAWEMTSESDGLPQAECNLLTGGH